MLKRIALPLLMLIGNCGSSLAADASDAWSHDWSGFYLGANAGLAQSGGTASGAYDWSPSNIEGASLGTNGSDGGSLSVGVLAGYNWQSGWLLAGLEADINYLGSEQSAENLLFFIDDSNSRLSASADWYGTLRARLGFASDRLMIYGTGGLAMGQTELSGSFVNVVTGTMWGSGSDSKIQLGWAAGAGMEFAIDDRWSAGAEYLHVDLGSLQVGYQDVVPGFSGRASGDFAFDVVRATLKYSIR